MSDLKEIMYVEDDQDIQAIVKLALERIGGYSVQLELTAMEALDRLNSYKPQLILLDVMMPGMDGPGFLAAMRKRADMQEIPVIFITAKVQKHEVESYYRLGAAGVITKPFDPMRLAADVKQIWARLQEHV